MTPDEKFDLIQEIIYQEEAEYRAMLDRQLEYRDQLITKRHNSASNDLFDLSGEE